MKKLIPAAPIACAVAAVTMLTTFAKPVGAHEAGFPDVPKDHWAYEAVTELKRMGILIGYPPEPAASTAPAASGSTVQPTPRPPGRAGSSRRTKTRRAGRAR